MDSNQYPIQFSSRLLDISFDSNQPTVRHHQISLDCSDSYFHLPFSIPQGLQKAYFIISNIFNIKNLAFSPKSFVSYVLHFVLKDIRLTQFQFNILYQKPKILFLCLKEMKKVFYLVDFMKQTNDTFEMSTLPKDINQSKLSNGVS